MSLGALNHKAEGPTWSDHIPQGVLSTWPLPSEAPRTNSPLPSTSKDQDSSSGRAEWMRSEAELWAGRSGCGLALGKQKGGANYLTLVPGWALRGIRLHSPGAWDLEEGPRRPPPPDQDPARAVCYDPKQVPCKLTGAATSLSLGFLLPLSQLWPASPISPLHPQKGQKITTHFTGHDADAVCTIELGCLVSSLSPCFPGTPAVTEIISSFHSPSHQEHWKQKGR